ncbi:MAG: MFS transporter [Syntrophomonadaceae bacterium]|nr:MFS transporter [Syntrophomonadaceae bacterium]
MSPSIDKPAGNKRYFVVFMVSMMIAINYLDRTNFSVAVPTIMKEFGLSAAQIGFMGSAFFWAYTLIMLPVGGFINKFGPKWAITGSAAGWGIVTILTGACSSFTSFFIIRILLGFTEAPGFPASARVVSVWTPIKERTFCSACFDCCARLGSAFTPPLVAWLILNWGWRTSFVISGIIAVIYAVIWHLTYHEPSTHPTITKEELDYIRQDEVVSSEGQVHVKPIPMLKLFLYPTVLKIAIAYGLYLYVWTVFNTWMPAYFTQERGLTLSKMGVAAMIPYATAVICELLGGAVWDRWQRAGASVTAVRRTGMSMAMLGASVFIFLTMQATTATGAIVYLSAFMGIFAFGAANVWAIPGDIAPYGQAGGVGGVYNFVGNAFASLAPIITGFFVGSHYGYNGAFTVCCIFGIISAILFGASKYVRLEPKNT